jgi:hypothetical protein
MIYSINDSRLFEGWLMVLLVAVLVFFVARNTTKHESLKFKKLSSDE